MGLSQGSCLQVFAAQTKYDIVPELLVCHRNCVKLSSLLCLLAPQTSLCIAINFWSFRLGSKDLFRIPCLLKRVVHLRQGLSLLSFSEANSASVAVELSLGASLRDLHPAASVPRHCGIQPLLEGFRAVMRGSHPLANTQRHVRLPPPCPFHFPLCFSPCPTLMWWAQSHRSASSLWEPPSLFRVAQRAF